MVHRRSTVIFRSEYWIYFEVYFWFIFFTCPERKFNSEKKSLLILCYFFFLFFFFCFWQIGGMFPRRFPCTLCLEDPESSMLIFPSECSVDCLKNIFFAETLAFLIFLFLSCNFFCFFFQRWDTGALKTTTQLTFDPMGQGTSESKNPLDQMFEHAFMFNRDLSKWKIPTSILSQLRRNILVVMVASSWCLKD